MGLLLAGCQRKPEFVFVPARDYQLSIVIQVPSKGKADQWIALQAHRRSGPWKQIRYKDLVEGVSWFETPPPSEEPEVADNLRWIIEPSKDVRFNLPTELPNKNHERFVMFRNPGIYRLLARTAYPTRGESKMTQIRIEQKSVRH